MEVAPPNFICPLFVSASNINVEPAFISSASIVKPPTSPVVAVILPDKSTLLAVIFPFVSEKLLALISKLSPELLMYALSLPFEPKKKSDALTTIFVPSNSSLCPFASPALK